jgi:hypothetical protein
MPRLQLRSPYTAMVKAGREGDGWEGLGHVATDKVQ